MKYSDKCRVWCERALAKTNPAKSAMPDAKVDYLFYIKPKLRQAAKDNCHELDWHISGEKGKCIMELLMKDGFTLEYREVLSNYAKYPGVHITW